MGVVQFVMGQEGLVPRLPDGCAHGFIDDGRTGAAVGMAGRALLEQGKLEVGKDTNAAWREKAVGARFGLGEARMPGDADTTGVFLAADEAVAVLGKGAGDEEGGVTVVHGGTIPWGEAGMEG